MTFVNRFVHFWPMTLIVTGGRFYLAEMLPLHGLKIDIAPVKYNQWAAFPAIWKHRLVQLILQSKFIKNVGYFSVCCFINQLSVVMEISAGVSLFYFLFYCRPCARWQHKQIKQPSVHLSTFRVDNQKLTLKKSTLLFTHTYRVFAAIVSWSELWLLVWPNFLTKISPVNYLDCWIQFESGSHHCRHLSLHRQLQII